MSFLTLVLCKQVEIMNTTLGVTKADVHCPAYRACNRVIAVLCCATSLIELDHSATFYRLLCWSLIYNDDTWKVNAETLHCL